MKFRWAKKWKNLIANNLLDACYAGYTGELLLSREMVVNEALRCDRDLMQHESCCIGFGRWAILRLRWNKGKFFLGKNYIIFGNIELRWLTHLKNTEFWSNISVISHDPCQLSWRVHGIYLCCFTSNRIILEHHFKIQNFAKGMWSKIFIAGYGFSAVAANCS